jgi:hypothetical protein
MKNPGAVKALPAAPDAASEPGTDKPASKPAGKKRGRKPGQKQAAAAPGQPVSAPAARAGSPVDLIYRVFDIAGECGGIEQLKRLVDRLAAIQMH